MLILDGRALSFAEARDIERRHVEAAVADGDPDRYMRQVAEKVADEVRYLSDPIAWPWDLPVTSAVTRLRDDLGIDEAAAHIEDMDTCVVAFVGGGDNGGDALYACAMLAERGKVVTAFLLKPDCHVRALAAARDCGVGIVELSGRSLRSLEGTPEWNTICGARVWIDGIVGIGAKGALTGNLAEAVEQLNEYSILMRPVIVSIDVPSGLTDDEGHVTGAVMRATHTMAVGSFKRAQILPPAAQYCGALELIEMEWTGLVGQTPADTEETSGEVPVYFYEGTGGSRFVQAPAFDDDKYARGVVGLVAGSDTYPGAGLLATRGALASGVGMVRLNSTRRVQDLVLDAEPGVVMVGGRIQAALIGPGLDEERREDALELAQFCGQSGVPLVIDAWALDLIPELADTINPETTVLTPHHGEAARLLTRLGTPTKRDEVAAAPLRYANLLHDATGCHVVLKGPVTIVRSFEYADKLRDQALLASFINLELGFPDLATTEQTSTRCDSTLVAPTTTSWAGTAGSGDVLAGLIAGILARPVRDEHALPGPDGKPQAVTPERLVSAVWLHGRAAKVATDQYNGRAPIQARDIADAIPEVLAAFGS